MLFLKMSSVREDADMFSMRCKLLEAEANRESVRTRSFKVLYLPPHSYKLTSVHGLGPPTDAVEPQMTSRPELDMSSLAAEQGCNTASDACGLSAAAIG